MSFDIPNLHIENTSPEGQVLEAIISRDHVSPEEAVRRALRDLSNQEDIRAPFGATTRKKPGELLFGLFADEPELMTRIAEDARVARDREIVKDHRV